MSGDVMRELRVDFTGDATDLERAADDAAAAVDDITDELSDVADQTVLTDRHFERLADELATMVRRAERAEGKVRDLRRELRKVGEEAESLDGKNVDVDVDVDVDDGSVNRLWLKLKRLDGTDIGVHVGKGISAGLGSVMDNDIAEAIGGGFAKIPPQAQLAVAGIVGVSAALATTIATAGLAGAALAGVGAWLYNKNPNSVMAQEVDKLHESLGTLATTVANVLQPAFDDIATAVGPELLDLVRQLKDWVVNNRTEIRKWAVDFAKAFLSGVQVVALLGKAVLEIGKYTMPLLIHAFADLALASGKIMQHIPGMRSFGDALVDNAKDANRMADDLALMADKGGDALGAVASAAGSARDRLVEMGDVDPTVDIDSDTSGFDSGLAGVTAGLKGIPASKKVSVDLVPRYGWEYARYLGSAKPSSYSVPVPVPGGQAAAAAAPPVYELTINVDGARRRTMTLGPGVSVVAV